MNVLGKLEKPMAYIDAAKRKLPSNFVLTPTQWRQLFGAKRKVKEVGRGTYAYVYESPDPRKVVKITRDWHDYQTTSMAQQIPGVVKLHAAHKLHTDRSLNTVSTPTHIAMVTERVRTMKSRPVTAALQFLRRNAPVDMCYWFKLGTAGSAKCHKTYVQAQAIAAQLKKRGLRFTDWHAGNVGFDKQGNLVLLDLGHNDNIGARLPPTLHGRR